MFHKYNAKKTEVDGIKFDSKMEADRYLQLKGMIEDGRITNLERQVEFEILPKFKKYRVLKYIADFTYYLDGHYVIEDVKGFRTPVYLLKKRLLEQLKNIEIYEYTKETKKKRTKSKKEAK